MINIRSRLANWKSRKRLLKMASEVALMSPQAMNQRPVAFFNATTRLTGFTQNSAFSTLTSWGLRLAGIHVRHFVCQAGMSHCVLGTDRDNYYNPPPCESCLNQSNRIYKGADVHWFNYHADEGITRELLELDVKQLCEFEIKTQKSEFGFEANFPLGKLVLPAFRWALRKHTLSNDEATRYLLGQYILSAYSVAWGFNQFLDKYNPISAVIFNGIMYPEAAARWIANQRGLRVITHEVSFQPYSAFFTEGDATAYPIPIPEDFELSEEQDARIDNYLEARFMGQFTMAGIRFWPEIRPLDNSFLDEASNFRQIVPIFTNVVYDTSQVHANKVFPHMFAWLDLLLELIHAHTDTLFVIRAHPDEMRPGTAKQSRESVRSWVEQNQVNKLSNVIFIDSQEYISSYELIKRSKFIIVYNSSIGMESTLLGTPVLCGGKARYTQYPMVFFPHSIKEFRQMAKDFLDQQQIQVPREFEANARRFLYFQLYRASLSFEKYLQDGHRKGFVELSPFSWQELLPENSATMRLLINRIPADDQSLPDGKPDPDAYTFLLDEQFT